MRTSAPVGLAMGVWFFWAARRAAIWSLTDNRPFAAGVRVGVLAALETGVRGARVGVLGGPPGGVRLLLEAGVRDIKMREGEGRNRC